MAYSDKEKAKAYVKAWREKNKERVRGYSRKHDELHPRRHTDTEEKRLRANAQVRKHYAENLESARERNRIKGAARVAAGVCRSCVKPPAFGSQVCEDHWFAHRATQRLGLGGNTRERGQALKSILAAQNYRCPYTGRKLVPGINASVDHIKPGSKHPELRGDLSNIQWVDDVVNRMKQDLSHDEFLELCSLITKRFKK